MVTNGSIGAVQGAGSTADDCALLVVIPRVGKRLLFSKSLLTVLWKA